MTQLVGILNLTPDSFSDGGVYSSPEAALQQAMAMQEAGAAVIDIGAESTRPGATPLTPAEEWARLEPVLKPLLKAAEITVSIDTRHPETAQCALDLGAAWINDVSGGDCAAVMRNYPQARYVLMHSLSVPADRAVALSEQADPVEAVLAFFVERLAKLELAREQVMLDPGIGFGKTAEQSWQLIRRASELKVLGQPVLFGHSRKSCFAEFSQEASSNRASARREAAGGAKRGGKAPSSIKNRDAATLVTSLYLRRQGIDYLRVHDIALHTQAFAAEDWLNV
jgi:dihydropteroate synthase